MTCITETEFYLLLAGLALSWAITLWALFVVLPSRTDTVKYLSERCQTLQYWIDKEDNTKEMFIVGGDQLGRKIADLQRVEKSLIQQLQRCSDELKFYLVLQSKKVPDNESK